MKIGINRWTLPSELPLETCFNLVRSAGFDCIEINLAEDGELHLGVTESDVHKIVASAERAGVELLSLSTGLGWRNPLTSPDPEVRRKGAENIRKQLQVARWMGVDTILVVPGIVSADIAYDEAYSRAQQELRVLAADAEKFGVAIGVENVWNKFLLSPLEFARFLDEIGSLYVGAYFDVGNVLVYGFPDQWIRILGARIKKIHVKDFKAHIGNGTAFCNPLQGDVPWHKVKAALGAIGYDGPITAEVEGYKTLHEIGLKHIAESLRAVFQTVERHG